MTEIDVPKTKDGKYIINFSNFEGNTKETMEVDYIIGADGANSRVAKVRNPTRLDENHAPPLTHSPTHPPLTHAPTTHPLTHHSPTNTRIQMMPSGHGRRRVQLRDCVPRAHQGADLYQHQGYWTNDIVAHPYICQPFIEYPLHIAWHDRCRTRR